MFSNHDFLDGPGLIRLMKLDAEGKLKHPLQIAYYDHSSEQFEFKGNFECMENAATEQDLVEITYAAELPRWTPESDEYGRTCIPGHEGEVSGDEDENSKHSEGGDDKSSSKKQRSNGVSMLLVPQQKLFAMIGKVKTRGDVYYPRASQRDGYLLQSAGYLLSRQGFSVGIKLLCHASKGVRHPKTSLQNPDLDHDTPFSAVCEALCIESKIESAKFVEVAGFHGADGSMKMTPVSSRGDEKKASAVTFSIYKPHDIDWFSEALRILRFSSPAHFRGREREIEQPDGRFQRGKIFELFEPTFLWLYTKEYGHKYKGYVSPLPNDDEYDEFSNASGSHQQNEGKKSAKWIPYWLWVVSVALIKEFLEGFRRGDGDFAKKPDGRQGTNTIYTSSTRYRDQLLMLMIMAGFAPRFTLKRRAGTIVQPIYGAETAPICNHDGWTITYPPTESSSYNPPTLRIDTDVHGVEYSGKTWTVVVPGGVGGLILRRAGTNDKGIVTKVSIPVIVGGIEM